MVLLEEKEIFFIIKPNLNEHLDFKEIFGNDKPITLEIGSGKGEFLALYSKFSPERNFFGIEMKDKRILSILKKLDREKNSNVRIMKLYVDKDIMNYIKPASIDEIIIFHPDPWPKKRHHKHRLFQIEFIDAIYPILKIGGILKISTDDLGYKEWIIDLFDKRKDFESMYEDGISMIVPDDHFWTYFDEVKSKEGYEPYFMMYKKIYQPW